jgi:hypothetical protein
MRVLSASSPRREDSQVASKLVAFMGELTAPLLPERERYELLVMFSLLSGLAFARPQATHRRAALCSDGTPLEISLALDDQGGHSVRFVCDVAAGMPDTATNQRQQFRDLAEKVVPQFDGSHDTLDRLFEMHLSGARDSSRFRVWFGAGSAPGSPRIGMLYFNAEWLSTVNVIDILAPHLRLSDTGILSAWPAACGEDYKGIAYDFDATGLRKVKLYLRPNGVGASILQGLLKHFPGNAGHRLRRLFEEGFGVANRARRGGFVLALGLPVQPSTVEATVYFHLESWGVRNFVAVTPILRRLLGGWGFDLDSSLSAGPRGCAPTLLSLSVSDQRQRLALYFKPLLNVRQV